VVAAELPFHGGEAGMLPYLARPRRRRALMKAVYQLKQETRVLHPDVLDAQAALVPRVRDNRTVTHATR
jgi:hypothetical protein